MPSRELLIQNNTGLHARPAAQIVKLCNRYDCSITLGNDEDEANAKSIMGLMMLAAGPGSTLTAVADGPGAEELLAELDALFAAKFLEE